MFASTLEHVKRNGLCATRRCETEDPKRHAYNDFTVSTALPQCQDANVCMTKMVLARRRSCARTKTGNLQLTVPPASRRCPVSSDIRASISHVLQHTLCRTGVVSLVVCVMFSAAHHAVPLFQFRCALLSSKDSQVQQNLTIIKAQARPLWKRDRTPSSPPSFVMRKNHKNPILYHERQSLEDSCRS